MSTAISVNIPAQPKRRAKYKPLNWGDLKVQGAAKEWWRSEYGHFNDTLYERVRNAKELKEGFMV